MLHSGTYLKNTRINHFNIFCVGGCLIHLTASQLSHFAKAGLQFQDSDPSLTDRYHQDF